MVCAFTLAAVCLTGAAALTTTASASGHDEQDVYVCDAEELVLYEQASYDSDIIFTAYSFNCELHVMEYLNGFGYCYVPDFDVNGWVDLSDTYYVETEDFSEKIYDDDDDIIIDDAEDFESVSYQLACFDFNSQFFADFTNQRLHRCLPILNLPARELPPALIGAVTSGG